MRERTRILLTRLATLPLAAAMVVGSVPLSAGAAVTGDSASTAREAGGLDASYIPENLGKEDKAESALSFDGTNYGSATVSGNNLSFSGTVINSGNGNGFKMGGTGISGKHILQNSVSFENKAKGIDSNSGPDIKVYNSTTFNNGGNNIGLYTNSGIDTDFIADGVLSYRSPIDGNDSIMGVADNIALSASQKDLITTSNSNYLWDPASQTSKNAAGSTADDSWFAILDTAQEPTRNADGSIDMHGLLERTDSTAPGIGNDWEDVDVVDTTLWVVGDSTVSSFKDTNYYIPRYGWGTQLGNVLDSHVKVENLALSGRSSKSFVNDDNYQTLLNGMQKGDYLMIGFGHNDEKTGDETFTSGTGDYKTEGSFAKSLYDNYIKPAQDRGVSCILVTPIVRINKDSDYTGSEGHVTENGDYAQAIRDLGSAVKVPVCDLTTLTKDLNTALDTDTNPDNDSKLMHAQPSMKEQTNDATHTNLFGAAENAYLIAEALKTTDSGLAAYIKPNLENPMDELTKWTGLSVNEAYEEPVYNQPTTTSTNWDPYKDAKGNTWYGSVFGDVGSGNETNKEQFVLGTDENGNAHISAGAQKNTGKIAGTSDGIAMYYVRIPLTSQFSLSADVTVNSLNGNGEKWGNQIAFGLMARDDMHVDEYVSATMGDYVVAGVTQQSNAVKKTFARKNGSLTYGAADLESAPMPGEKVSLKIESTGDGYAATYNGETVISDYDFALNAIDSDYAYVGMFASRGIDVTFENIELTIDDAAQEGLDSYAGKAASIRTQTALNSTKLADGDDAAEPAGWEFRYFATSTGKDQNTLVSGFEPGVDLTQDNNGATVSMTSCTKKSDGTVDKKGGKFLTADGYDGISYYFTTIDSVKENFYLQADVTVDYINPTPDGQEGFALLARDTVGVNGDSDTFYYSNSMATMGTKFDYTDTDGVVHSGVKDTIGYRAMDGIKSAVNGEGAIHEGNGLANDPSEENAKIKAGQTYTLGLRETDSAYIMTYYQKGADGSLTTINEGIYYKNDAEYDPLRTQDKNNEYVGFAVARGCDATFSNIKFYTTEADPSKWEPRPTEEKELDCGFTSASTSSGTYTVMFKSNADGKVTIKADDRKKAVVTDATVKANELFTQTLQKPLTKTTKFTAEFTPDPEFKFNDYTILSSYDTVTREKTVEFRAFKKDTVYVSPSGSADGKGTKASPIDLATALRYARPGQEIVLASDTYKLTSGLKIERGVGGAPGSLITVRSENAKNPAIIDFARTGSGLEIWGDYWHFKNINFTNSTGKGLQVSGDYNVIEQVNCYNNGNTGLQVSGTSNETIELWPSYNLIKDCTSMNNADAAMEDADGFAAKLTTGPGNVFDGCISAYNADDGWDLFAKAESGPIGNVTIKNCVAYRNGFLIVREPGQGDTEQQATKKVKLSLNGQNVTGKKLSAQKGKTYALSAATTPAGGKVQFSTSDKKVATVTADGKVKIVGASGTAKITAKSDNGKTAVVTFKATSKAVTATSVKVAGAKAMAVKEKQTLKLTVSPATASQKVAWTSSNAKVASVSKAGVVTAQKKGTAIITATTKDGSNKTAKIKITVKNK